MPPREITAQKRCPSVDRQPPRSAPMPPQLARKVMANRRESSPAANSDVRVDNTERPRKASKPINGCGAATILSTTKHPPATGAFKMPILPENTVRSAKKRQAALQVCEGCGEPAESCDSPGTECAGTAILSDSCG
jgi:hypothetical protein